MSPEEAITDATANLLSKIPDITPEVETAIENLIMVVGEQTAVETIRQMARQGLGSKAKRPKKLW